MKITKKQKKKIKKLNKILNKFLKPFGCTAVFGSEFSYILEYKLITYEDHVDTPDFFTINAEARFPSAKADPFIWSFIHELGHHETRNLFSKKHWKEYMKIIDEGMDDVNYVKLPIEDAATAWAARFIEYNPKKIKKLWKRVKPFLSF